MRRIDRWHFIIGFCASLCAIPIAQFIIGIHILIMIFNVNNMWWLIAFIPVMALTFWMIVVTCSVITGICGFILAVTE